MKNFVCLLFVLQYFAFATYSQSLPFAHLSPISEVDVSADENLILTRSQDKLIVWDIKKGNMQWAKSDVSFIEICASPVDSRFAGITVDGFVLFFDMQTGELLDTLYDAKLSSANLQWFHDGSRLLIYNSNGTASVVDVNSESYELIDTIMPEKNFMLNAVWGASDKEIICIMKDGRLFSYNLDTHDFEFFAYGFYELKTIESLDFSGNVHSEIYYFSQADLQMDEQTRYVKEIIDGEMVLYDVKADSVFLRVPDTNKYLPLLNKECMLVNFNEYLFCTDFEMQDTLWKAQKKFNRIQPFFTDTYNKYVITIDEQMRVINADTGLVLLEIEVMEPMITELDYRNNSLIFEDDENNRYAFNPKKLTISENVESLGSLADKQFATLLPVVMKENRVLIIDSITKDTMLSFDPGKSLYTPDPTIHRMNNGRFIVIDGYDYYSLIDLDDFSVFTLDSLSYFKNFTFSDDFNSLYIFTKYGLEIWNVENQSLMRILDGIPFSSYFEIIDEYNMVVVADYNRLTFYNYMDGNELFSIDFRKPNYWMLTDNDQNFYIPANDFRKIDARKNLNKLSGKKLRKKEIVQLYFNE